MEREATRPHREIPSMSYSQKLSAFNNAIQDYEDTLADYRRAQKSFGDGEGSLQYLEEAREEVVAARVRFEAAERALHG